MGAALRIGARLGNVPGRPYDERHARVVCRSRHGLAAYRPQAWSEVPSRGRGRRELSPREIRWRVQMQFTSKHDARRLRPQLEALGRPILRTKERTLDLGARDIDDAVQLVERAAAMNGVVAAHPTEIRGRLRRWSIQQRLLASCTADSTGSGYWGYGYVDFSGGGGDGLGGGHGGGHGGHGGDGGGGHGG